MKVLLINPWDGEVFPTPAIGYLQAVLKANGVDVIAKDIHGAMADESNYDMVAVTFHSFSVRYARSIRAKFKGHLICGGHHSSALPDQMLSIGYDQVVIGEGENAIMEIINGNKESIIQGSKCKLDDIPFPDYSGLSYSGEMGIAIISSRGCPFDCSFCASSDFWKRRYRVRSVDNVILEIIESGVKRFMFEDDNFTINRQRAIEICKELRMIGGFSWQCASRAESLIDDELCWNLRSAGCHTIWLGIESLSQDSLSRCRKNTTVDKMLSGIRVADSHGLQTMCQFLVGLPGDCENDITETINQIKHSKIKRRGSNIAWILPNTEIHTKARQKGFSDDIYLQSGAPFYTYEQDMNTLNRWSNLINQA